MKYSMSVKLLTEHHLEFLSLKGGCTGSSESVLVKMPHCWKSHAAAQIQVTYSVKIPKKTLRTKGKYLRRILLTLEDQIAITDHQVT